MKNKDAVKSGVLSLGQRQYLSVVHTVGQGRTCFSMIVWADAKNQSPGFAHFSPFDAYRCKHMEDDNNSNQRQTCVAIPDVL